MHECGGVDPLTSLQPLCHSVPTLFCTTLFSTFPRNYFITLSLLSISPQHHRLFSCPHSHLMNFRIIVFLLSSHYLLLQIGTCFQSAKFSSLHSQVRVRSLTFSSAIQYLPFLYFTIFTHSLTSVRSLFLSFHHVSRNIFLLSTSPDFSRQSQNQFVLSGVPSIYISLLSCPPQL